jgi:hypothetical protein
MFSANAKKDLRVVFAWRWFFRPPRLLKARAAVCGVASFTVISGM